MKQHYQQLKKPCVKGMSNACLLVLLVCLIQTNTNAQSGPNPINDLNALAYHSPSKVPMIYRSVNFTELDNDLDGMPVRLENFNGIYANGFTRLGWNTLMEYNLGSFVIERSRNGNDYDAIGTVDAFGNTNNFSSYYTFMDISSERGSNFYRLKLLDKDNNFSYSKVIAINTEAREISLLLVYPNPFGKKVQAKIECEKPEKLTVRVINSQGQVVRTQYNELMRGENIITVNNVADLPGGAYVLEMIAASRTMRTQIMKQ